MDIYSDWILVDHDRSCGLDRNKRVKVLSKTSTPESAEKYDAHESWTYREDDGRWMDYVFAYKTLITPAKTETAYRSYARFIPNGSTIIIDEKEAPEYVKISRDYEYGIAKEVTMNGRPISFNWKKAEK